MTAPPIRLLSVTKSTGGLAEYNRRLVTRLNGERFRPEVVCLSDRNTIYAAELQALGIPAVAMAMARYTIDPLSDLGLAVRLLQYVRRRRYDVLVGHGSKAGFLVRLVGRLAGVPAVYALATMAFLPRIQGRKARLYAQLERVGALMGGHIVTITGDARDQLVRRRVAPARQITVIRTGIDLSEFGDPPDRTAACASLGLDPERPVIGWAARLSLQKAPGDYVQVAAQVLAARPDAQVFMAGEGELKPAVQAQIDALGLREQIVIRPWQTDVPTLLAALDVYVQTSHWEGLPQAVLEAMAMRCTVVATAVDGTREAIVDGESGLLLPAGDVTGMAAAISALLGDEPRRRQLGAAARRRIESAFTSERMISEWEDLLRKAAGQAAGRS